MPVHVPEEHKHRLPLSAVPKRKAVQNARSAELAAEREEELDRAREEAFKQGVSEAEGVVAEAKARLNAMAGRSRERRLKPSLRTLLRVRVRFR